MILVQIGSIEAPRPVTVVNVGSTDRFHDDDLFRGNLGRETIRSSSLFAASETTFDRPRLVVRRSRAHATTVYSTNEKRNETTRY